MQYQSRLHAEILSLIEQHVQTPADKARKSKVGQRTMSIRKEVIFGAFNDLNGLGYKLQSAHNLREKHVHALGRYWEREGQTGGTIENKISVLRTFAKWIGKPNMVKAAITYVENPNNARRTYATTTDKTWTGHHQDPLDLIHKVSEFDARVGIQLELQHAFGMRKAESMLFRPHLDDLGSHVVVFLGAKNKRLRTVPVESTDQRDVLSRAKTLANSVQSSTIPQRTTLARWGRHYQYVLKKYGITKGALGITSHGLRHEYINQKWEELAGSPSPIKGGDKLVLSDEEELRVRNELSLRVGHSRASIVSAYSSSHTALQQAKNTSNETLEEILRLRQEGITNNAEIGRRLGITRQAVSKSYKTYTAANDALNTMNRSA